MTATITIQGKVLGRKKPILSDWIFDLPVEWQESGEYLYLRAFITRIVLDQVSCAGRNTCPFYS
jgi:hypothetical protein